MVKFYDVDIESRLLLGTARYPSLAVLREAIIQSKTGIATVSLRRESGQGGTSFWDGIKDLNLHILPNTAGCSSVKEVMTIAQMAREIFKTNWIKLEVIGDEYTLQPDVFLTLESAKNLIADGFQVFPYMTDDLGLAEHLLNAGCKILMPWAAPIGSGQGVNNPYALRTMRARFPEATLIVDAGIGAPSHAAAVMEMGYDAVLLNTAVSRSGDPVKMATAFKEAVSAGRLAYEAGMMPKRDFAEASTPLVGKPFWHQQ